MPVAAGWDTDTGKVNITHAARSTGVKTADDQIVIYQSKLGDQYRIEQVVA